MKRKQLKYDRCDPLDKAKIIKSSSDLTSEENSNDFKDSSRFPSATISEPSIESTNTDEFPNFSNNDQRSIKRSKENNERIITSLERSMNPSRGELGVNSEKDKFLKPSSLLPLQTQQYGLKFKEKDGDHDLAPNVTMINPTIGFKPFYSNRRRSFQQLSAIPFSKSVAPSTPSTVSGTSSSSSSASSSSSTRANPLGESLLASPNRRHRHRLLHPKLKILSTRSNENHDEGVAISSSRSQNYSSVPSTLPPITESLDQNISSSEPLYGYAHFASDPLNSKPHEYFSSLPLHEGDEPLPLIVWFASKYNHIMTAILSISFIWMVHMEYMGGGLESIEASSHHFNLKYLFLNLTGHEEALLAGTLVFLTTFLTTKYLRSFRRRKRRWSQLVTRLTFETRNILRFQHHERYYPALFLKEDLKEKILMHKDALISEFLINSDGELRRQVFLEIWSLVEKELMADSRIHVTELTIDGFQKICWKYSSSDLCLGKEPVTTSSSSPSSSSPPSSS